MKNFYIKYIFTAVILLSTISVFTNAQPDEKTKLGFESIAVKDLRPLVWFLSSSELEGRKSGERGGDITAKFVATHFAKSGLEPVSGNKTMLQKFSFHESSHSNATTLTIVENNEETRYSFLQDFIVTANLPDEFNIDIELVFAKHAYAEEEINYDDFKGIDIKDKYVLAFTSLPKNANNKPSSPIQVFRSIKKRKKIAEEKGAKGIIFIDDSFVNQGIKYFKDQLLAPKAWMEKPEFVFNEIIINDKMGEKIFSAAGLELNKIREKLSEESLDEELDFSGVKINFDLKLKSGMKEGSNVVGYFEGSDPELKNEVVVIGAHYDHLGVGESGVIFHGADDNASGTSGIMEVAEAFTVNEYKPKRSLLFIAFGAEELGLIGSKYYTNNPLLPLENTYTMINIDMIGRNALDTVQAIGSNFHSNRLHELSEEAANRTDIYFDYSENSVEHPERTYFRSDQINFAKKDIPVVYYTSGDHKDYHRPSDTFEKINFEKIQKVSRLVYFLAWELSNNTEPLNLDGILFSNK